MYFLPFQFGNIRNQFYHKWIILLWLLPNCCTKTIAQDTSFKVKHSAIFFPYPMYRENWRASIGFTLLTTPEDITEETQFRLPAGDLRVLRKINKHFILDTRLVFQFLQNHLSVGVNWVKPLGNNIYFSAGDEVGYWFGFLKIDGFNSKGHGFLNYPNISFGYKTRKNLLITLRGQISVDLYYKSAIGEASVSSGKIFYNGETFTLALEQPFYGRKHLTLAVSAINNYFYWQTWALFYKTDRKIFYPQITVGFIL